MRSSRTGACQEEPPCPLGKITAPCLLPIEHYACPSPSIKSSLNRAHQKRIFLRALHISSAPWYHRNVLLFGVQSGHSLFNWKVAEAYLTMPLNIVECSWVVSLASVVWGATTLRNSCNDHFWLHHTPPSHDALKSYFHVWVMPCLFIAR